MTIGFIGLGVMGEPMCRNLLAKAGDRLVAEGVEAGGSVAGVVARADVTLISMPGGPELEAVVAGPDGVLSVLAVEPEGGRLVVDHTTAPVELTRDLAARCRALGAEYLDAPIARTRQAAVDGTLSIMVGGSPTAFEAAEPILAMMATDITHCGGVGAGQVTKLLNNMMLFQNVRAVAEAHAIASGLVDRYGDDLDLDVARLFGVIAGASGGSFGLTSHGMKAVLPDEYPLRAFSTEYALKDLGYAIDLAEATGVDAVGATTTRELLEAARDAGFGDEYWPVIRRML